MSEERRCGECSLCCKLLPVVEGVKVNGVTVPGNFNKPAGVRCVHQRHTGCRVYRKAGMPVSCRLWSCAWLTGESIDGIDTRELRRPDRCHYVVDTMPDFITVEKDGEYGKIPVLQIWIDPAHPDVHRAPELRAFLARAGEHGVAALIRYNSKDGFVLFPPAMTPDGSWHEERSRLTVTPEHGVADKMTVFGMEAR